MTSILSKLNQKLNPKEIRAKHKRAGTEVRGVVQAEVQPEQTVQTEVQTTEAPKE